MGGPKTVLHRGGGEQAPVGGVWVDAGAGSGGWSRGKVGASGVE